ncbi:MAG: CBS domain-containing protein [Oricola sp.]
MQAKDIMTTTVVTVRPDASIAEIAHLLLERRISAVPVVDSAGRLLGIVSEGDLMRRPESGTGRHPSWWLSLIASPDERAMAYVKAHGRHARDAMTRDVISVSEEASLEDVAELLEKHRIKRVPVLRDSKLCGIVSRADLLHGLVARKAAPAASASDGAIKVAVENALPEATVRPDFLNVVVSGGVVHLWGAVESDAQKQAARVAAESVPGVKDVRDEIGVLPPGVRSVMWAE